MTLGIMRAVFGTFLVVLMCLPFFVHSQSDNDNVETEIRAALRSAEGGGGLTETDFNLLSDALIGKARESSITADDIALSRIESALSASALTQRGSAILEGKGDWIFPFGSVLFLALFGLVALLWQKMHHGGALGANATGVTGLHKEEPKRLPWVR